jgi:hypothetical protein
MPIEGRMKFRVPEIFLGVFLAVAIFAMGMLFASSIFPPNVKRETAAQNHSQQEASKPSTDERIADYTWWLPATLDKLYKRGLREGQFRPGIDMIELYISIVSVCSYHISNQYTLSILLQTDLMADERLDLREQHSTNMILRHL